MLILMFVLCAPSAHSLIVPEPPSLEEQTNNYLCGFLLDYDLAIRAYFEMEVMNPQKITPYFVSRMTLLQKQRDLVCRLGYWRESQQQDSCLEGKVTCFRKTMLGGKGMSINEVSLREYTSCKTAFINFLSNPPRADEESWLSRLKTSSCRNLVASSIRNFKSLSARLKEKCRENETNSDFNSEALEIKISEARMLLPTFDALYEAKVFWISHYLCLATPFLMFSGFDDPSLCFQYLINQQVENLSASLKTALAFKQMCENIHQMDMDE